MDVGGTAQLVAAHCPNERTLDPAVLGPSHTMAFTLQCSPAVTHYFSATVMATHLPARDGWKAELA